MITVVKLFLDNFVAYYFPWLKYFYQYLDPIKHKNWLHL